MQCQLARHAPRSSQLRHAFGVALLLGGLLTCLPVIAQAPAEPAAGAAAEAVIETAPAEDEATIALGASSAEAGPSALGWSLDPATWIAGVKRLVELGGAVVIVQLVVSVIGFAAVMFKILQFLQVRSASLNALHRAIDAWASGDAKQGQEILKRNRLPFARDVEYAIKNLRADNIEVVREELYRRARIFLQPLHDHLPTIEIIYYIAPLLGLLGTVTGIIASFQALEASGAANDAALLAAGIWEALLATGVGLSMAIPFAVLHALLETRLNRIIANVEDVIARVFTASIGPQAA